MPDPELLNPPDVIVKVTSTAIIMPRLSLDEAADAYRMFKAKDDQCVKVVLKP